MSSTDPGSHRLCGEPPPWLWCVGGILSGHAVWLFGFCPRNAPSLSQQDSGVSFFLGKRTVLSFQCVACVLTPATDIISALLFVIWIMLWGPAQGQLTVQLSLL